MHSQDMSSYLDTLSYRSFASIVLAYITSVLITIFNVFYFMTALNDVLTAEQESEQAIVAANEAAAVALQAARVAQQERLKAEEEKLAEAAIKATATEEARVAELAKDISTEVDSKVSMIKQRFAGKKDELKTSITQCFQ